MADMAFKRLWWPYEKLRSKCLRVETVGISMEQVYHTLYKKLRMKKLCVRWAPRLLTVD